MNHFLNGRRRNAETEVTSFDTYGDFLECAHAQEEMTEEEKLQYDQVILHTRNRCMTSMLLCLDRSQRMVFVLGAVFGIKSGEAARLLGISAENFRKQLSRAKHDLFEFMNNRCGLINPNNPCRCSKKAKGFMREGKLNPDTMSFNTEWKETIEESAARYNDELDALIDRKYLSFFRQQPYEERAVSDALMKSILLDEEVKKVFHLN